MRIVEINFKGIAYAPIALVLFSLAPENVRASCLDEDSINGKIECLEQKIENFGSVPQGAVAAFDLQACPIGWESYSQANGRMIIGAFNSDGPNSKLLGQTGGAESHTLTLSEMPKHNHRVSEGRADTQIGGSRLPYSVASNGTWQTGDAGGSQPHNNMPPFVALTICKKQ